MNTPRTFRFHRFSDNSMNIPPHDFSKYLLKTMRNNELKNNIFNNNDKNNIENEKSTNTLTDNLKLFQFKNNENDNKNKISLNQLIQINLTNENYKDYVSKIVKSNLDKDENILLANKNFKMILKQYQNLLQYLLKTENKVIQYNKLLYQTLNNIENEKPKIDYIELDNKIEKNEREIMELNIDIENSKIKILSMNENENPSNNNIVLDIHDEENNYYCDICPFLIFKSYDEVVTHYNEKHKNILKKRQQNIIKLRDLSLNNEKYTKFYFNKELDFIKNELKYYSVELQKENNTNKNDNKNENKKHEILKNNNINNLSGMMKYSDKNVLKEEEKKIIKEEEFIFTLEKKLNTLEKSQNIYQENFQKNFIKFKNEVFHRLKSLNNNKPISIINNNINNNINQNINNKKQNDKINKNLGDIYDNNSSFKNSSYYEQNTKINKENENLLKNKKEESLGNNKNKENDIKRKLDEFAEKFFGREKLLNLNSNNYSEYYNIISVNQNDEELSDEVKKKIQIIEEKYHFSNDKTKEEYEEIIKNLNRDNNNLINQKKYIYEK